MIFWQEVLPAPIFFSWGRVSVHWYGLLMVLAILSAGWYAIKAKNRPNIKLEKIDSLFFYLIIFGLIGARFGHVVFFNWDYFSRHLLDIFKIWQGGLSILGVIVAGVLTIYFWGRKNKIDFWLLADWLSPALILGQAIGRWGNYFNQELYGRPTTGWWGIIIAPDNRVSGYENFSYFQPTFFYESILDILLFFVLLRMIKIYRGSAGLVTLAYLSGYSAIRFGLEFIRLDPAPLLLGWRLPQIYCLVVFLIVAFLLVTRKVKIRL